MTAKRKKCIIVGISGASGAIYGIKLLKALKDLDVETHLIITKAGKITIEQETNCSFEEVIRLSTYYHNNNNIAASIASGSFKTDGMVIAPCTAKTLAEIANGLTSHLLSRAAEVILKERRKLVLLFRETPLTLAHIRNMEAVTEMGAIVAPPVPAFYTNPSSIDDLVDHQIGKICDLFDMKYKYSRWAGLH